MISDEWVLTRDETGLVWSNPVFGLGIALMFFYFGRSPSVGRFFRET